MTKITTSLKVVIRLKVSAILCLVAIGLLLRDIWNWAIALIAAGVTLGVHIGPLQKAAQRLFSQLWMLPVRLVVAFLFLFGVGVTWVEELFSEGIELVDKDLYRLL